MGTILQESVPLLLSFVNYEQRYADFPGNLTALLALQDAPVERKGDAYKGAFIALTVISTIVVVARIWTRRFYLRVGLWWDDWLIIASLVFAWGWTVIQLLLFYIAGVGTHVWNNSFVTLGNALQLEIWDQFVYIITVYTTKLSILFFLIRITPPRSYGMRRVEILTIVLMSINFILQLCMILLACKTPASAWDITTRLRTFDCLNWYSMLVGFSIIWSATDFWILMLPMPLVWGLRTSLQMKLGLSFVFGLGAIASIASVIKIFYLGGVYSSWDPTWNAIPVLFWHQVEVSVGLITASLPTLSVFFIHSTSEEHRRPVHDVERANPDIKFVPEKLQLAEIVTDIQPMHSLVTDLDDQLYLHYPPRATLPGLWEPPKELKRPLSIGSFERPLRRPYDTRSGNDHRRYSTSTLEYLNAYHHEVQRSPSVYTHETAVRSLELIIQRP